jgi:protease-4
LWHYLVALKKKYGKPVVFSFGNVAASGGYYIACTGDTIFLSRGTITGSIGVVSGKLSLKRLYEMLGINKDVIKMSEFADIFTESRDLSEAERQVLQRAVDFTYDVFTGRVQEGRNIPKEKIPSVAEGRVFTGRGAMEHRLADSAGGLLAAIDYAGRRAGISGPYRVEGYPATRAPLMEMLGTVSVDEHAAEKLRPLAGSLEWLRFGGETGLYLFPYRVEIK